MSKKTAKKSTAKPIRTSLRGCYLRIIGGVFFLMIGALMLLSAVMGEHTGAALDSVRNAMRGVGGGSLALFLPIWMLLVALLLLTGLLHSVSARSVCLLGAIYALLLGFATLITYVDRSGGQNVMEFYRGIMTGGAPGIPSFGDYLKTAYAFGANQLFCHGALGMLIAYPVWRFIGSVGGAVLLGTLILALGMLLIGLRPGRMINAFSYWRAERGKKRTEHEGENGDFAGETGETEGWDSGYGIPDPQAGYAPAVPAAAAPRRSGGIYVSRKREPARFRPVPPRRFTIPLPRRPRAAARMRTVITPCPGTVYMMNSFPAPAAYSRGLRRSALPFPKRQCPRRR